MSETEPTMPARRCAAGLVNGMASALRAPRPSLLRAAAVCLFVLGSDFTSPAVAQGTRPATAYPRHELAFWAADSVPEVVGLRWGGLEDGRGPLRIVTSSGFVHDLDVASGRTLVAWPSRARAWRDVGGDSAADGGAVGIAVGLEAVAVASACDQSLWRSVLWGRPRLTCEDWSTSKPTAIGVPLSAVPLTFAGHADGSVYGLGSPSGFRLAPPTQSPIAAIEFDDNGALCVWADLDSRVGVWDIQKRVLRASPVQPVVERGLVSARLRRDGRALALAHGPHGGWLSSVAIAETGALGAVQRLWEGTSAIRGLAYGSEGTLLALADESGCVRVVAADADHPNALPETRPAEAVGWGRETRPAAVDSASAPASRPQVPPHWEWQQGDVPLRGVVFADRNRLLISIDRDGTAVARAWPSGTREWTARVPMLRPADGDLVIEPRGGGGLVFRAYDGKPITKTIRVEKTGTPDLRLTGIVLSRDVGFSTTTRTIAPGRVIEIDVTFTPSAAQKREAAGAVDDVSIGTNCESQPVVSFSLFALLRP